MICRGVKAEDMHKHLVLTLPKLKINEPSVLWLYLKAMLLPEKCLQVTLGLFHAASTADVDFRLMRIPPLTASKPHPSL